MNGSAWDGPVNATAPPPVGEPESNYCLIEPFLCRSSTVLFRTVATIFSGILILLIVLLNAPLLFAVVRLTRTRLKSFHVGVASVVAADLFVACVYLPVLIAVLQRHGPSGCEGLCTALVTLEKGSIAAAVWSTTLISVDRYLFVVRHAAYVSKMSVRRATAGVVVVWLGAVAFGAASYYLVSSTRLRTGECVCHLSSVNYGFSSMVFTACFIVLCSFLPLIVMATLYGFLIRMTYAASKRLGAVNREHALRTCAGARRQRAPPKLPLYDRQMVQITVLLLSLFVLLSSPYFVITLVVSMGHWAPHSHPYFLHIISVLLFHANTTCNALFYGYSNRRLRDSLLDYVCAALLRRRGDRPEFPPIDRSSVGAADADDDDALADEPYAGRSGLGGASSAVSREAFLFKDSLGAAHCRQSRRSPPDGVPLSAMSVDGRLVYGGDDCCRSDANQ